VALGAGLLLDWILPAYVLTVLLPFHFRLLLGVLLILIGGGLALAAERTFHRAGTNVQPWKPTLRLATGGIYARTRNPIYLGTGLLTAGIAIALASDWTLVLLVPAAFVLHFGVVLREECYLARKFGDDYRRYLAQVPRYGWRL
jgi:protein-S-isoprenylcysteine O-methyltransferase Ste14